MTKHDIEAVLAWFTLTLRKYEGRHPDREAMNRLQGFVEILRRERDEGFNRM